MPQAPKTGVLLVQLGTPDAPTLPAVRRYLKEFLSDRHVIDFNPLVWRLILNLIILPVRSKKSAGLYKRLFTTYGPVLLNYTRSLASKLQTSLGDDNIVVRFGMRYGHPSLKTALRQIVDNDHCDSLLIVPLFPQFSRTTTGSIADFVKDELARFERKPSVAVLPPFYNQQPYTRSVSRLINRSLEQRPSPPGRIILSYHGLPKRYVKKGDPYEGQCLKTTELIKKELDYPEENILHTYQSRFGPEAWLSPYTDETLVALAKSGIGDVLVACPSFTMDCLETLDEIGVENRKLFLENGGKRLELVSCLNDHDHWVKALAGMISRFQALGGNA